MGFVIESKMIPLDLLEYFTPVGGKPDVWKIPTQPMPDAHFATFPKKLIEPCILAGTSEKGCCVECGAPWERVVEKKEYGRWDHGIGNNSDPTKVHQKRTDTMGEAFYKNYGSPKTIGWQPTCKCNDFLIALGDRFQTWTLFEPCTVLDPFFGSGTTGLVAYRHDRKFVGIELSQTYLDDIAIPRIKLERKQRKLF